MPEKRVEAIVDGRRIVAVNTWFSGERLEVDGQVVHQTRRMFSTQQREPILWATAIGDSGETLHIEVFLSAVTSVRIMILVNGAHVAGDYMHDEDEAASARAMEQLRAGASGGGGSSSVAVPSTERSMDTALTTEEIVVSLSDARVWCAKHENPEAPSTCLRSREIQPGAGRDWHAKVRALFRLRHTAIATGPMPDPRELEADGELFLYVPTLSLDDGAAQQVSGGFLDLRNAPPWDTWVAWVRCARRAGAGKDPHALLAWIPRGLVAPVQHGIDVNPEQCIGWARDERHDEVRAIAALVSHRGPRDRT